jgi:hypothetical protein
VPIEQAERIRAERVELGWPVQRDERDAAGFAVLDIVSVVHASPPLGPRNPCRTRFAE